MPEPISITFTDEDLTYCPSYSWQLRCCWCGSGVGAHVKAHELNGLMFNCGICGKGNFVRREGNTVTISSPKFPAGCAILMAIALVLVGGVILKKIIGADMPSVSGHGIEGIGANILRWAGYLAAVITIVKLPLQILRWRSVRQFYGGIPWSLLGHMRIYSQKNRLQRIQFFGLYFIVLVGIVPIVFHFVAGDVLGVISPLGEYARAQRLPVALITLWLLQQCAGYLVPPSALLLGTSSGANVNLMALLNINLRRYRIVSLLDIQNHGFGPLAPALMYSNLRTSNGYEWRTVVHHLMDVVPLLLVDDSHSTEYIEAEINRIDRFDYRYKVISYSSSDDAREQPVENGRSNSIGLERSKRLANELVPQIQKRLKRLNDQQQRRKAQDEYTAMLNNVPRAVRFSSNINAMLIKAHFILNWSMMRFLKDCKAGNFKGEPEDLIEDIPSRAGKLAEAEYLRVSRGHDEARGVATSALDLAKLVTTNDPNRNYNIANAEHKLGKCDRFCGEYSTALQYLNSSIIHFKELLNIALSEERLTDIRKEMADAHFHRGEVRMALYRQGDEDSRQCALLDFQECLALDRECGNDPAAPLRRIEKLQKSLES